jgi:hypothetical protein
VEVPLGDKFLLRNLGKIETVVQKEFPLTRGRSGRFVTEYSSESHTLQSAGTQVFFIPVEDDSISIGFSTNRYISDTSGTAHTVAHHTRFFAENRYNLRSFDNLTTKISGGAQFLRANGSEIGSAALAAAELDWRINNLRTQLWCKYDAVPLTYAKHSTEIYFAFGANLHYQFPIASIYGGYSNLFIVSDYFYNRFWHILPYEQPENVFSFGGSLGEIAMVSMFSSWLFSDKMPHIKSYSGLRFRFNRDNTRARQFYTDINYNYWSRKNYYTAYHLNYDTWELTPFGDYPHWNRSIHDISLKLAAEIQTFRVFWKIDNFLNRTNSYVPGYIMPGLIFRWGFSWNVLG